LAIIVEFWPALAGISFIKKKIKLYLFFIALAFFTYNFKYLGNLNPEIVIHLSFGSKTIESFLSLIFPSLKIKYFFINFVLVSLSLIMLVAQKSKFFDLEFKNEHSELEQRLFLIGATLYCGLFMITSNYDYKLIFLIFCIPYTKKIKNIFQKYFLMMSMIISSNQVFLNEISLKIFNNVINSTLLSLIFKSIVFIILLNLLINYLLNLFKKISIKKILFG